MSRSPLLEADSVRISKTPWILQLQDITKYYRPQSCPAIDHLTLSLRQGEILGLLGPSGCGKTTLLRFIAGFEVAQSGSLMLGDRIVVGPQVWVPPEERSVGMVFQDFALFPHLTVFENIAFGLKLMFQRQKGRIQERVLEVLDLVGLTGFQQRYPHELSGGQQQRVALARALAPKPTLVLLDEPLSNLDVQVRLHLRQELRTILKAAQTSAVFVTHDQEEALAIADQVAVMRCGQLEQVGTPEVIYSAPASKFVAEFVTQANFLSAHREDQLWQTELGGFEVWNEAPMSQSQPLDTLMAEGLGDRYQKGWLMIRQEDIRLHPDPQGRVKVYDRQFLGREYRYCLRTPSGKTLHALSHSSAALAIGTTVSIAAVAENIRVFPKNSEQ
jgi:iron(III) transport system ATP-binding protein